MATIFDLFAKSPFGYLQKHMQASQQCFELIPSFFAALKAGDQSKANEIKDKIDRLEHEADKITKEVRVELYSGKLKLAIPTEEVLALVKSIDDVADATQDIAVAATLKSLDLSAELAPAVENLISEVLRTCQFSAEAVGSIDQLLASSFDKREVDKINELIDQTKLAEHEADVAGIEANQKLYTLEQELGAVAIFRWAEVLKSLGILADKAEVVAKKIFGMLVQHSNRK